MRQSLVDVKRAALLALWLLGAALGPSDASFAAAGSCGRACLRGVLDQYLAAVFRHDPQAAPLAADARTTQNAVMLAAGQGIWRTASGYGPVQRRFFDPRSGQAAYFGLLMEGSEPAIVSLRIKVAHAKITEAEWTIARKSAGGMFSSDGLTALPPPADTPLPAAERTPRAQMIAAANAYFQGLQLHDGSAVPHIAGCERVENGFRVTNRAMPARAAAAAPAAQPAAGNAVPSRAQEVLAGDCVANFQMFAHSILTTTHRRFPLVDEQAGVVMGTTLFHRPPESTMKRNLLTEYFFVRDGKIAAIYAAMYYLDPGAPDSSGWSAGTD